MLVMNIWEDMLTEQDRAVIDRAGYARGGAASWDSRSLGSRPALLLIDLQVMQLGRDVPILEAVEEYQQAMGNIGWQAVPAISRLLHAARAAGLPVFHTRVIPRGRTAADPAVAIVSPVAPVSGETVLDKNHASAFFGTDLLTRLVRLKIDTLIVAGNSTSGCVRATVVDARQFGLHPLVPAECTFDRIVASHKVALLDMWLKYARVCPLIETLDYITAVSDRGEEHAARKG